MVRLCSTVITDPVWITTAYALSQSIYVRPRELEKLTGEGLAERSFQRKLAVGVLRPCQIPFMKYASWYSRKVECEWQ